MAVQTPGVWGIDLGQCALKALRLEMRDGQPVATAFEHIEHPKLLNQPDADPDQLTQEALTQFLGRNNIRGDQVAISVPGQSGLARFVKLPPVDEKKIADIVKFEAKQQIPFPLDEVVWDFQRLNKGDVIDGLALETEIGLFAMKRDMVHRTIQAFKKVNIEVHTVQMAPLALCNFIAHSLLGKGSLGAEAEEGEESLECIVGLEIGTDNSNLVITNGGRIIWQRPIPIGGNHFTRALTKEMKLTFAKAEHLKRNAAKSPELKKILAALKQVLNDFVGEVQRSLGYFTNTHRNAQIQYMIGLGNAFRLPGLQKFLQEKLQLEVRKLQKLERITGETVTGAPTFSENILSFAVAYGLAVQGLNQARLQTNLLPPEVRLERVIRAKKPWALTAAASLLFGMFALAFARGMEKEAVMNTEVDAAITKFMQVKSTADSNKKKYDTVDKDLRVRVQTLSTIGAGVGERFNWQLLHQYINLLTPQPNGDRLTARSVITATEVRKEYWDKDEKARKAFELYELKRVSTKAADNAKSAALVDKFIKQHLIQVNIVGINAVYSDSLDGYYFKIGAKDAPRALGMKDSDYAQLTAYTQEKDLGKRKAMPDIPKDGWVVELRGYTYHHKGERFVEDTIVENLQNPDNLKGPDGKELISNPVIRDVVQKRVRFLYYERETVQNAVPGQFKLIAVSKLRGLIKGGEAPDQGGGVVGGGVGDGGQRQRLDNWKAIGEMAGAMLGDGAAPAAGGPAPPPIFDAKGNPILAPARTEFAIRFIWQEPLVSAQAILDAPKVDPAKK